MLKIIISIIVSVFFITRDALCYYLYPNMKTSVGDWDGSNALTMNIYAIVIGLSFLGMTLRTKYRITLFFCIIPCWFSFFDLLDRSFQIYNITQIDRVIIIPASILLSSLTYAYAQRRNIKKSLD